MAIHVSAADIKPLALGDSAGSVRVGNLHCLVHRTLPERNIWYHPEDKFTTDLFPSHSSGSRETQKRKGDYTIREFHNSENRIGRNGVVFASLPQKCQKSFSAILNARIPRDLPSLSPLGIPPHYQGVFGCLEARRPSRSPDTPFPKLEQGPAGQNRLGFLSQASFCGCKPPRRRWTKGLPHMRREREETNSKSPSVTEGREGAVAVRPAPALRGGVWSDVQGDLKNQISKNQTHRSKNRPTGLEIIFSVFLRTAPLVGTVHAVFRFLFLPNTSGGLF